MYINLANLGIKFLLCIARYSSQIWGWIYAVCFGSQLQWLQCKCNAMLSPEIKMYVLVRKINFCVSVPIKDVKWLSSECHHSEVFQRDLMFCQYWFRLLSVTGVKIIKLCSCRHIREKIKEVWLILPLPNDSYYKAENKKDN